MNKEQENKNKRPLVKLLQEITKEEGVEMKTFSRDWIITLEKNGKVGRIFGYNFSLNDSFSAKAAQDKVATTLLLQDENIPVLEHVLVSHPRILKDYYGREEGNWDFVKDFAKKHDYKIVLKPNNGGGGNGIEFVNSEIDLEIAIQDMHSKNRDIAISPRLDINEEIRCIYLDGEILLAYKKERPSEIIDGEKVFTSNQHNLSKGAEPIILDPGSDEYRQATELAIKASEAIGIRFSSTDVILVNGEYKILEINSGVFMNNFMGYSEENYSIAKEIHRRALQKMFD